MAVPAHDQRDLDFARTFGLPVRVVVDTGVPDPAETGIATPGDGTLVNSGPLDGLDKAAAIARITAILAEKGQGRAAVNYRLRDWLVSRQRFWGAPIPIVYCDGCGEVPVPDEQLPVVAARPARAGPGAQGHLAAGRRRPTGSTRECPKCGGPAKRDTDTMDTFVDSSWYFLRYCSPALPGTARSSVEAVRRWMPDRPVRRRRRARDPAPAVLPVLHQGAVRHGHGRLHRAVHAAAEPGPGDQPGQGDDQVAGQRRRPGGAAGRVRRRRDPADDGLRQPARGRHRLGRRAPEASVKFLGRALAAGRGGRAAAAAGPARRRR